ncbi:MAG: 3-hydroxyisobutyrate dehydrogenase [Oleiphilaceae bacterium]|nr:3-hydroxyisobutyrate dehydrogenase [Oleiphilaceae bacterium]
MTRIAFIGLGNMGGPMAMNLVQAGFDVHVYDRVPEAITPLVEAGAKKSDSLMGAAEGAEVVITMLPAGEHCRSVYLGEQGLLAQLSGKPLLIDCSTIDAVTALEINAEASAAGFSLVDAPVSGGTAGAAAGTLTFIVGGESGAVEQARPVLDKMGKHVLHAGPAGAGQVAKICNNMLLAVQMIGTAESLQLGVNMGLDPKVLSDIMQKSSGRNWALELYNPYPGVMEKVPASRDYQGGFAVDLMNKDLGLALEAATGSHSSTPMGNQAKALYQMHSLRGSGKLDFSSILKQFRSE